MTLKSAAKARHKAGLQTIAARRAREQAEAEARWNERHPDAQIVTDPNGVEHNVTPKPPPKTTTWRIVFDQIGGHDVDAPTMLALPADIDDPAQAIAAAVHQFAQPRISAAKDLRVLVDLGEMTGAIVGFGDKMFGRFLITVKR